MTAIGFVFLALGFVLIRWFGVPLPEAIYQKRSNWADKAGLFLMGTGFILMLAGLGTWLWGVMP